MKSYLEVQSSMYPSRWIILWVIAQNQHELKEIHEIFSVFSWRWVSLLRSFQALLQPTLSPRISPSSLKTSSTTITTMAALPCPRPGPGLTSPPLTLRQRKEDRDVCCSVAGVLTKWKQQYQPSSCHHHHSFYRHNSILASACVRGKSLVVVCRLLSCLS